MTDFRIPKTAIQTTCRTCGAAIVFTTLGKKAVPLDLASARTELTGERAAVDHRTVCRGARPCGAASMQDGKMGAARPAAWPATWAFPAGALEPLTNPAVAANGELVVTFSDRWALYDCLVVTGLARARGLRVGGAVRGPDGVTRVVMG